MKTALPAPNKAQTQQDIANACNLSRATVGKILSGGKEALLFSPETRQKVREASKSLGYRPNRAAQTMRKGRSNLIAIIYFNSSVEDGWRAAGFLSEQIKEWGYDYLVFDYLWHGSSMDDILQEVIQLRAEGVVLLGLPFGGFTTEHSEALRSYGIPAVALSADDYLPHTATIFCDSTQAFASLTRHLIKLGHKNILFLIMAGEGRAKQERSEGFRMGLSGHGQYMECEAKDFLAQWPNQRPSKQLSGSLVSLNLDSSKQRIYAEGVYAFCKELFATGKLPDAIMCSNDAGAISVFLAAHEFDIKVPRDLAVTGYDNDDLGAYPMFDLTTARQDVRQSCIAATETIMSMIRSGEAISEEQRFSPHLVLRGSCGSRLDPLRGGAPSPPPSGPLDSHPVNRSARPKNRAFTLLELLVTVSIVAILATLLLAGTRSFIASGKAAACASNLRTLGVGFASYAADNNNLFPTAVSGGYWPEKIAAYVPRKAFFCPEEKKGHVIKQIEDDKRWKEQQPFVSYGYNNRYMDPEFGLGWTVPRPRQEIRYSSPGRLSEVMVLADAGRLNSDGKSGWGFYVMEPQVLNYSMPLPRHKGNANVLWADGSVSARKVVLKKDDRYKKEDDYKYITERNWDWRLP